MGGLFGITGWGTIVLAWALAIAAVTCVTLAWPRLARRGVGAVVARVATQLLVAVLVALAVGTVANRYGLWFVSWRDLASIVVGPTTGEMSVHGAEPPAAAGADLGPWGPAAAAVPTSTGPEPDAFTPMETYTVTGPASGLTGTVHVWRPEGEAPAGGYPVVQVFHGYPVSAQSAFANLDLGTHVSDALGPALVIVADWSPGEFDTECVDGPAGDMETWLTTDVPAWAVADLGARADRGSWATLGYSAGGWCAAMAAMRHPQTYAAGITFGGYTRPLFSSHYAPFEPIGSGYDLPLLAALDPPAVAVLAQYSPEDAYAAPTTGPLLAAAQAPLSVTAWAFPDHGHRVGAWEPLVPDALAWLTRTAPAFAPRQ